MKRNSKGKHFEAYNPKILYGEGGHVNKTFPVGPAVLIVGRTACFVEASMC